jgi:uncharacterized Fe-S center protein
LGFQERLVDYCAAVKAKLDGRVLFLNVIRHYQKGCDCFATPQESICPDVGIVASRDLVAADIATADLLIRETGRDVAREAGECDYRQMLAYAERIGVGSCSYELIES